MRRDDISRLCELCLRIANIVDRRGEDGTEPFLEDIGMGYRVLSNDLRRGVKAIIDLQGNYASAKEESNLARIGEQEIRDTMQDIFGDRDFETINKNDRARVREFVQSIIAEWDEEESEVMP